VAIDVKHEINALREARKLGIPTICLIDTDGDPDLADIPIPGNDDSMRSIDVVVRELCLAVNDGKQMRTVAKEGAAEGQPAAADTPRRSRRAQFRADDTSAEAAAPAEPTETVRTTDVVPARQG
jgi:small subunit ribosomal protein S2